tara:strand:+ start:21218 stop:21370 length:153 start_codon:yes stop_codon:yes gene_type:complete
MGCKLFCGGSSCKFEKYRNEDLSTTPLCQQRNSPTKAKQLRDNSFDDLID